MKKKKENKEKGQITNMEEKKKLKERKKIRNKKNKGT